MTETLQFTKVCAASELAEGQMHAVQVADKRVLVALVEGVPYALGAVCTHERAYLDQGTLMGHEVYCPLHFSCFDVRTGEALAPPADRATTVYAVKITDGEVFVSLTPVDPDMLGCPPAADGSPPAADDAELGATPAETPAAQPGGPPEPDGPPVSGDHARSAAPQASTAPTRPPAPALGSVHQRIIERVEELPGLASCAEALGAALRPVRESQLGGRVFDLLHGRRLGHALHPALSDLPIGFWAGGALLDVAGQRKAATILTGAGVVTGVATAATGVADWTVSDGRDRRVGLVHGALQTVALLVSSASIAARVADRVLAGQILLEAGLVISASSAYLGGHLVFGRGVMVDHTAWIRGPRTWTRALPQADLAEGEARAVDVDGRQVLVSMNGGVISAIENACTHAGGPLSLGPVSDGIVKCPWHGSCFRLCDGAVVRGPASHPQPVLDVQLHDGWIEVRGRGRW